MAFNHHPSHLGIWFVYNHWRYKTQYDLELNNGVVLKAMSPNGGGWSDTLGANLGEVPHLTAKANVLDGESSIRDRQVKRLRLTTDTDLERFATYSCMISTGQARIDFQIELFGDDVPELNDKGNCVCANG